MLLRNLFESTNKTAVLGWGRGMGHKGHMLLAQAVIHHAAQIHAEPFFVVSRTSVIDPSTGDIWSDRAKLNRTKDDPLTPDEKLATYKKVFPDQSHIFSVASEDATKLEQVIAKLVQQGFKNVVLVVGEQETSGLSYLTKPDKSGTSPMQQIGLNDLQIISRQTTKAPGSDVSTPDYQEGPRATPMRQVLLDPSKSEEEQFAIWRRDMPDNLSDEEVMNLMQTAKARLIKAHTPAVRGKKAVEEQGNYVDMFPQPNIGGSFTNPKLEVGQKVKVNAGHYKGEGDIDEIEGDQAKVWMDSYARSFWFDLSDLSPAHSKSVSEGTSIDSTLRAIINDIGEPITNVYDTMKFQAKKYMENHGELGRGFRMVAAGVGGRWVQNMYIGRLHNELHDLCKYNTRRTVDLRDFLRGEEDNGELEMKRSFGNLANNLPPILAKLGEQLNAPQLTRNAQRWMQNKAEYERYLMDLEASGDEQDEPAIKPPKSTAVGQQNAQVDQIVNDVLSKIPKNIAGEIRNAIARAPNKLAALKQELDRHHVKMAEGVAEGLEQTPDQVRQTLNAWMEQDQQYTDPTQRAGFQTKVWPYIQQNIKTILADKGEDGKGSYPASPYAAWLLVQHMDAYPQNQGKFLQQLAQSGLNPGGKLQFLKDRYEVNKWILQNANNEEYFINNKPLPNPTVNVRNPAMFKDAGIVATSRKDALDNAIAAGNKLLVAAVQATDAKTQPSYKQGVAEGLTEAMLTEAMLREAFLDSITKFLGDKIKEPVKQVTNLASSLQVLYKVVSDPQQLDTTTMLLKKNLKSIIKSLPPLADKLKQYLVSMYPEGRSLGDFFKTLLLVAVGKMGSVLAMQIKDVSQDAILDAVIHSIQQIPQLAGMMVSQGASGIGNVLQTLKIGNALWFDILNQINSKIQWANKMFPNSRPGAPVQPTPAVAPTAAPTTGSFNKPGTFGSPAMAEAHPNQQAARYNPNGTTYRGSYNKMPTLDPDDPVHNADRYGPEHDKPYEMDYDKEDLKRAIAKGMSDLSDTAKHILELRFWDNMTYEQIASEIGVSRERIRQIEAKALRQLKHPTRSDPLRPFVQVAEAPKSAAVRLGNAIQRTQGKTAASQARSVIPSSIPKPEPKKDEKTTETSKNKCVPVSEDVENIMDALINKIIVNEAISYNQR